MPEMDIKCSRSFEQKISWHILFEKNPLNMFFIRILIKF